MFEEPMPVLSVALLLSLNLAGPQDAIASLERGTGGRIGLFALDVASGRALEHRSRERFAMCSTFKWLLAADVLTQVFSKSAGISLETTLPIAASDSVGHSPVTRAHLRDGRMTVGALVDAAVEESDNAAANLLLSSFGGPAALTAWLRGHGDRETRLDRNEPTLNTNLPDDPRDTTTPAASAADLKGFLLGDQLPGPARERLRAAMEHCRTGGARLRAGLPPGWPVAHKTGTCDARGAVNDVAVIWPDAGRPIVVVAYLSDSAAPLEQLEAAEAELARVAVRALVPQP